MLDEPSLYRALFDAYPDALLLVDGDGKIVLSNPEANTLLGYADGELTGQSVDVLVPDAIRPRHAQYRDAYRRDPRPRPMGTQMDLVAKCRNGSEVMVEIALSPLQGRQLPYVVVAIRSIGAYPRVKQAMQRARYSEYVAKMGRLAVDTRDPQMLLQQMPAVAAEALQVEMAVLYLLEPDRLRFRVTAGVNLLPGEGVGDHIANLPGSPAGVVLAGGRPMVTDDYREEVRAPVPKKYIDAGLVSALAVPLFDRGRTIGVLTVRSKQVKRFGDDEVHFLESLSNLIAATLQRMQTEETLNHAQRLETVGQLTGGVAHDFNNLLTVIQGNLQILEERPTIADDAQALQLVGAATRASRRAAELTGKLLAFSRRQVLTPSRVDIAAMLHSLADMLRRTLDQRIRIEVSAAASCPACLVDAGQLESALLNIAINARDAMPTGGSLTFSCEPCRLPSGLQDEFQLDRPTEENLVAIAISDTGGGMCEEVKERAFEPFFTTKEVGRGTGLGLSTVYGFIKQSKGAITLHSQPGEGTTVTLYLPQGEQAVPKSLSHPSNHALPAGLRVLLVEDEPEVRIVAKRFLEALGCVVTACADAAEATRHLESDAAFELLLSDIALGPGMRGTELAREAQARRPEIGVLLMSGFSAELLEVSQTAPPAWELLAKPYSRNELHAALTSVLAAGSQGPSTPGED